MDKHCFPKQLRFWGNQSVLELPVPKSWVSQMAELCGFCVCLQCVLVSKIFPKTSLENRKKRLMPGLRHFHKSTQEKNKAKTIQTMKFYTQISMTQLYNLLNTNSDLFSIWKFILCFHPSPKEHSAKWYDEISRVKLQSYSLTTLENNEKLHPYKYHVRAWTRLGRSALRSDWPAGELG